MSVERSEVQCPEAQLMDIKVLERRILNLPKKRNVPQLAADLGLNVRVLLSFLWGTSSNPTNPRWILATPFPLVRSSQ